MDINQRTDVKMLNTDKWGCRQTADALHAFGIARVVTSPGSRNTPLLMAVNRHPSLTVYSVIDERSAAFMALGMAIVSGVPTALICTSGSALLDYAPAVAEAFYRRIPLIVISADRPAEWIDQNDSQTIRQPGALANVVKATYSFKAEASTETERWFVNRTLNDALITATSGCRGPVHINIGVSDPLSTETDISEGPFRKIDYMDLPPYIPNETARSLGSELCGKKVLVAAGFNAPSSKLNKAMSILAGLPNVAVIAEGLANIHAEGIHTAPDRFIAAADSAAIDALRPDVLITFGGALVSAPLKRFLRALSPAQNWHVDKSHLTIDCYMSLTRRVDITPEGFFPKLATSLEHLTRTGENTGTYAGLWRTVAGNKTDSIVPDGWNGMYATAEILQRIPRGWNLQLSNGMSVRYALANDLRRFHRVDCNRGVSGIDGSVSTAVGASTAYDRPTLLITGDMSMQYDMGALASEYAGHNLKIAVLNNGGGGIFRFIRTTAHLPEMPTLMNGNVQLPLARLAEAFGFGYLSAVNAAQLDTALKEFVRPARRPVILEIFTDGNADAEAMKEFYEHSNH